MEKGYVIFYRARNSGEFKGLIEHSFSMGFSGSEVRVWRDSSFATAAQTVERLLKDYRTKYPDLEWFAYRVGSKNCPVKIDWTSYHEGGKKTKYGWRNLKFVTK